MRPSCNLDFYFIFQCRSIAFMYSQCIAVKIYSSNVSCKSKLYQQNTIEKFSLKSNNFSVRVPEIVEYIQILRLVPKKHICRKFVQNFYLIQQVGKCKTHSPFISWYFSNEFAELTWHQGDFVLAGLTSSVFCRSTASTYRVIHIL